MQSLTNIAAAVRDGTLSPVAVVEESLACIDALDPEVIAWVELDREAALQVARAIEEARSRSESLGPLAGVPVGIKDIIDVAGLPTRAGAPPFAHYNPERDAAVVRRLREAGAIVLGKTHTTEFAYLDPAPTRNPWNRACTPGGSSSGSAAAVAAGMVPLAIGSQTVGSVLRPAAYCGIIGLKPSYGRVSCTGVVPLARGFDHLGVLATSVADAALALSVIAGHDEEDAYSLDAPVEDWAASARRPVPPRIGMPFNYYHGAAESENEAHLEEVAERLRNASADVIEVAFPANAAEISDQGTVVMQVQAAAAHADRYVANKEQYRPNIRGLIERGGATDEAEYQRSLNFIGGLRDAMQAILQDVDVLLLPVAPGTAPALGTTGPGLFCGPASFTGLPSIALPSGVSRAGLPYSVQLVGPSLGESRMISAAAWVEDVLDFQAKPELPANPFPQPPPHAQGGGE